jgi:hypothetical protein
MRDRTKIPALAIDLLFRGGDALSGSFYPVHSNIARGNRTNTLQDKGFAAPEIYFYD